MNLVSVQHCNVHKKRCLIFDRREQEMLDVGFEPTRLASLQLECNPLDQLGQPSKQ